MSKPTQATTYAEHLVNKLDSAFSDSKASPSALFDILESRVSDIAGSIIGRSEDVAAFGLRFRDKSSMCIICQPVDERLYYRSYTEEEFPVHVKHLLELAVEHNLEFLEPLKNEKIFPPTPTYQDYTFPAPPAKQ